MLDGFKYWIPIQKTRQDENGDWYVEGVASGTEEDLDEQRMAPQLLQKFVDKITTSKLPLTDNHVKKGSVMGQLGDVIKAEIMDDGSCSMFIKAKLDSRNPAVPYLLQQVADGKRFAFSVEGTEPLSKMVWSEKLQKPIVEFQEADPSAISITSEPSYLPSFINVLAKSRKKNLKKGITESDLSGEEAGESDSMKVKQDLGDKKEEMEKRKFSEKEREKLADENKAMPDGSFPIANEQDLKNAIKAYGRAKDKSAAKAHIQTRAKALGLTKLLPGDWNASTKDEKMKKSVAQSDDAFIKTNLDINNTNMSEKTVKDIIAKAVNDETETLTQSATEQATETSQEETAEETEETKTEETTEESAETTEEVAEEETAEESTEETKAEEATESTEEQSAQEEELKKSVKKKLKKKDKSKAAPKDAQDDEDNADEADNADADEEEEDNTDSAKEKKVKKSVGGDMTIAELTKAVATLTAEISQLKKSTKETKPTLKKSVNEDETVVRAVSNLTDVVKSLVEEFEIVKSLPLAKKSLVSKSFEDRKQVTPTFQDIAKAALGDI